jgi:hypothetical protein
MKTIWPKVEAMIRGACAPFAVPKCTTLSAHDAPARGAGQARAKRSFANIHQSFDFDSALPEVGGLLGAVAVSPALEGEYPF